MIRLPSRIAKGSLDYRKSLLTVPMISISPKAQAVPMLNCRGQVVGEITQDQLNLHAHSLLLETNRRGYVQRVRLRPSIYPNSKGDCFEQHLPSGAICFALTGVTGS